MPHYNTNMHTKKKPERISLRLTFHFGGDIQSRTEDRGFAVLGLTTWLCRQNKNGAENEARTRDPHLGKVVLYH